MNNRPTDRVYKAQRALAAYDLPPAKLTYLGHSENITWRVDTPQPAKRYLLRLHQSPHHTAEAVWSEASWLTALRAETDIVAPVPILNQNNQMVTTLSPLSSAEPPQMCTLMEWVEGRCLSDRRTPSRAFRVGDLLARIHRHGETWIRPAGWTRPLQDSTQLGEHLTVYQKARSDGRLTGDDLAVIEETVGRIREAMTTIGQGASDFGLVHGDFHRGNYLFYRGEVRPIDFSFCGDSYFLSDLAYTMKGMHHQEAFLEGYQGIRPLSPAHLPWIETFMVWGTVGEVSFHMDRAEMQDWATAFLPRMIAKLRDKFLKGEHLLIGW